MARCQGRRVGIFSASEMRPEAHSLAGTALGGSARLRTKCVDGPLELTQLLREDGIVSDVEEHGAHLCSACVARYTARRASVACTEASCFAAFH